MVKFNFDIPRKNKVNESINEILKRLNKNHSNNVLFEMAYPRNVYKDKILNELGQILENWCLVRYCILTERTVNRKHWTRELRGHLLNTTRYKLKKNNTQKNRFNAISEVFEELEIDRDVDVVDKTINNKFEEENIPTNTSDYAQVLIDCVNESEFFINVISSGEISVVDDYINKLMP